MSDEASHPDHVIWETESRELGLKGEGEELDQLCDLCGKSATDQAHSEGLSDLQGSREMSVELSRRQEA